MPDVKGMTVAEAGAVFDSRGLACIVSDSTYVKDKPAGCILDYNPAAGQKVKEGRIIYLTINAINIPLQVVPDVADNSSLRQAAVSRQRTNGLLKALAMHYSSFTIGHTHCVKRFRI